MESWNYIKGCTWVREFRYTVPITTELLFIVCNSFWKTRVSEGPNYSVYLKHYEDEQLVWSTKMTVTTNCNITALICTFVTYKRNSCFLTFQGWIPSQQQKFTWISNNSHVRLQKMCRRQRYICIRGHFSETIWFAPAKLLKLMTWTVTKRVRGIPLSFRIAQTTEGRGSPDTWTGPL